MVWKFSNVESELAGYQIIREIGKGGFGECWLARHRLTGCMVVAKSLERVPNCNAVQKEVDLWSGLNHERIIRLYEVISVDCQTVVICEFAERGDLFNLMTRHPSGLPETEAMNLFYQVCEAVQFLHGRNIAHRDIKLENVFITRKGHVKLGDFGFAAKLMPGEVCQEWMGSTEYSAPEVLNNEPYDPLLADSWSLGIMLFTLLKGYCPFSRVEDDCRGVFDRERIVKKRIIDYDLTFPDDISLPIKEILQGLLCYDPKKRLRAQGIQKVNLKPLARTTTDELVVGEPFNNFDSQSLGAMCRILQGTPPLIVGSVTDDPMAGAKPISLPFGHSESLIEDIPRTEEGQRRAGWLSGPKIFRFSTPASSYSSIPTDDTDEPNYT